MEKIISLATLCWHVCQEREVEPLAHHRVFASQRDAVGKWLAEQGCKVRPFFGYNRLRFVSYYFAYQTYKALNRIEKCHFPIWGWPCVDFYLNTVVQQSFPNMLSSPHHHHLLKVETGGALLCRKLVTVTLWELILSSQAPIRAAVPTWWPLLPAGSPQEKGVFFPFLRGKPQTPQWSYSTLHQLFCWRWVGATLCQAAWHKAGPPAVAHPSQMLGLYAGHQGWWWYRPPMANLSVQYCIKMLHSAMSLWDECQLTSKV